MDPSVLNKNFEAFLEEEYDEEGIGELDEDDPTTKGELELDDEKVNTYMDDFLKNISESQFNFSEKKNNKSSQPSFLNDVNSKKGLIVSEKDKLESAQIILNQLESGVLDSGDDSFEYVEVKKKDGDQWDCESILSTYSNTENHPRIISEPKRLDKIEISKKSGIPLTFKK